MNWWLVGHGHLGRALAARLDSRGVSYNHISAQRWNEGIDCPDPNGSVLLAVPDGYIAPNSQILHARGHCGPVFHCSGATPLEAMTGLPMIGVWYPMQSFRDITVPWGSFPVYWENEALRTVLQSLHRHLGIPDGQWMDSERRAKSHLSAVWANNFPTHLVALYQEYCAEMGIEPMSSVFLDSVQSALNGDAKALQTGPARRHDQSTLDRHLALLPPKFRAMYQAFSDSIARLDRSSS